jgi:hypothetical protein
MNRMGDRELNLPGTGWKQVEGCFKHGDTTGGPRKLDEEMKDSLFEREVKLCQQSIVNQLLG